MAKVRFDMVAESSTTTGTGTFTLGGAKNPGRTFATAGVATSDTFKYRISHDVNNEWEVGTGTLASSTTFTRSVIASSNANALVNFSAGNKTVELVVDKGDLDAMDIGTGGLQTVLGTVTSGNVDAVVSAASDTVAGKIEIAIQSEMETGTDVVRAVTPGRQHFHQSAAKFWLKAGITGNLLASYNITSVSDTGTGVMGVTIGTDISSANYAVSVSVEATTTTWAVANARECHIRSATLASTGFSVDCIDNTVTTNAVRDPTTWHCIGFGDL